MRWTSETAPSACTYTCTCHTLPCSSSCRAHTPCLTLAPPLAAYRDKSGEISYTELNKALRSGGNMTLDPKLMAGGAGEIQLSAKNKSPKAPRSGPGGLMGQMANDLQRPGSAARPGSAGGSRDQ